jgi:peptidase E
MHCHRNRIKASVARDEIVYAGLSAAAVIAFDSLKGLELTDDPKDVPPGYDPDIVWEGLGFVPFALAVHYKSDHPPNLNRLIVRLRFMSRLAFHIEHRETVKRSSSMTTKRARTAKATCGLMRRSNS